MSITMEEMNVELFERYHLLLNAATGYIKDNYADSVQPENDHTTDWFLARIKYAMYCLVEALPVPENCGIVLLEHDFLEQWVQYLEQDL